MRTIILTLMLGAGAVSFYASSEKSATNGEAAKSESTEYAGCLSNSQCNFRAGYACYGYNKHNAREGYCLRVR